MTVRAAPLVVLGLDTGDPDAIRRWVTEGRLPTIAGLMARGAWGQTAGPELVCEYGVGLTLFSGISRARHGHYYFRQLAPGTYDLETVAPPLDRAPPFWSVLRGTDARVLVVDVPDVGPLAGLDGLQLADWATHHGSKNEPRAEPAWLLDEARRTFGERMIIPYAQTSSPGQALRLRDLMLERVRRKGELCRSLLNRGPFDLSVLFFSETDPASHAFWRYRPEASAGGRTELGDPLYDVYAAVDAEFGRILQTLPEETNVVLVSLYGCQDEYPTSTLVESFLRELGYHLGTAGAEGQTPTSQRFDPVAFGRRYLPRRLRDEISRRLPQATQERLLASALRDGTDWSRTTAFAVPSLFTSFVRVNLAGREPAGVVQPGAEYDAVLDRLAADFELLVDEEGGGRAVRRTARSTELFGGGPPVSLPDLFVEWEPGPRMLTRVRHPRATLVQGTPGHWTDSQERLTGFVAAAGPAIAARGDIGDVDLLRLAPTCLALLGADPTVLDGRPLDVISR